MAQIHKPVLYNDEVLLYGLARYFGIRKGTKPNAAAISVASLLLALYRIKGPVHRDPLMKAAGLSHNTPVTFRTYIFYLRAALGHDSIYLLPPPPKGQNPYLWQLSFEGRKQMDEAFSFIQKELEESIHPTRPVTLSIMKVA